MNWEPLANWLNNTGLHTLMVEYSWMFPLMETIHFVALTVLFGSLLVIDLRVLGVGKFINMKESMKFIPVAMIAFAFNLLSGIAFLAADPFTYFPNMGFQWKMGMIAIAGLNALWFWFGEHEELSALADGADAPFRAKVIAAVSLFIWVVVIVLGRMIPYLEF